MTEPGATHAARRDPEAPGGVLDLATAGESLLAEADSMSSGRAARTLTPKEHGSLKQTLLALRAGEALSEHQTNGHATIQLLRGRATITASDRELTLHAGEWAIVPDERHDLRAAEDVVALLTVAMPTGR